MVASAVRGITVCDENLTTCTGTDSSGYYSLTLPAGENRLALLLRREDGGYYLLGSVTVNNGGGTYNINPYTFMDGNGKGANIFRSFLHALAGDTAGNATTIDLSGVRIVDVEDDRGNDLSGETFKEALRSIENSGGELRVDFVDPQGVQREVKVSPDGGVQLCDTPGGSNCQTVDIPAYDWLVLIYMDGDNNLSDYADKDLEELRNVTYYPTVKVVALVDHSGNGGGEIYQTDDRSSLFVKTGDIPEPNMGDPQTLEDFVKEYADRYPARRIALIFWDHGYAWKGPVVAPNRERFAALDETNDNDVLYMYEVTDALRNLKNGGINIDFIGFDECLMGNMEVFYDVSVNTRAVAASEALEPGTGWDYSLLMNKLNGNPQMSAYDFAKAVVDSYREAYENNYCLNNDCTMLAIDTDTIRKLVNGTDQIADYYLNNQSDADPIYSDARSQAVEIDVGSQVDRNLIDLYSFVVNLRGRINSDAPSQIVNTINGLYKYTNTDKYRGISIFFPEDNTTLNTDNIYFCGDILRCSGGYYNPFTATLWDNFLYRYLQLR